MADKQENVVKNDDTKQEGANRQAIHQEDANEEGVNHQDDQQEDVKLKHTKKEIIPRVDVKQSAEEVVKQQKFLEQVALVYFIKQRYFNPRTGILKPEDDDYIDPEELEKLIDLDIGRILPNLYISQASCSVDPAILQQHHITSILSITTEFLPEWESLAIRSLVPVERHLLLPADDNMVINLLPFFASICDWIDEQIEIPTTAPFNGRGHNGKNNVLVHCCKAVSRSPTIGLAYYLRKKYPNNDTRKDTSFNKIYEDFINNKWTRTWPKDTSRFLEQLKVWFDTGYQIWEDEEKKIPKWEYKRFLEIVREPELKALQEVWEEATGESAWGEGELGLTVVGVKDYQSGNVKITTWDEAKEIMEGIPKEKTLEGRTRMIRRYVYGEKKKEVDSA